MTKTFWVVVLFFEHILLSLEQSNKPISPKPFAPGVVRHSGAYLEKWDGIDSYSIQRMLDDSRFPYLPNWKGYSTNFAQPSNWGNNFGSRLRAYFVPKETGYHVFYLSSNNEGNLYLSNDEDYQHKSLVASIKGTHHTKPMNYTVYNEQESFPFYLIKGKYYYMEALMKAFVDEDNLDVAVKTPDRRMHAPITSEFLWTAVSSRSEHSYNQTSQYMLLGIAAKAGARAGYSSGVSAAKISGAEAGAKAGAAAGRELGSKSGAEAGAKIAKDVMTKTVALALRAYGHQVGRRGRVINIYTDPSGKNSWSAKDPSLVVGKPGGGSISVVIDPNQNYASKAGQVDPNNSGSVGLPGSGGVGGGSPNTTGQGGGSGVGSGGGSGGASGGNAAGVGGGKGGSSGGAGGGSSSTTGQGGGSGVGSGGGSGGASGGNGGGVVGGKGGSSGGAGGGSSSTTGQGGGSGGASGGNAGGVGGGKGGSSGVAGGSSSTTGQGGAGSGGASGGNAGGVGGGIGGSSGGAGGGSSSTAASIGSQSQGFSSSSNQAETIITPMFPIKPVDRMTPSGFINPNYRINEGAMHISHFAQRPKPGEDPEKLASEVVDEQGFAKRVIFGATYIIRSLSLPNVQHNNSLNHCVQSVDGILTFTALCHGFIIRDGFLPDEGFNQVSVSFESACVPNYYIGVKNYKFVLIKKEETSTFYKDTSFSFDRNTQFPVAMALTPIAHHYWYACQWNVHYMRLIFAKPNEKFELECSFFFAPISLTKNQNPKQNCKNVLGDFKPAIPAQIFPDKDNSYARTPPEKPIQQKEFCIAIHFINKASIPLKITSDIHDEPFLIQGDSFKFKRIVKRPELHRFVVIKAKDPNDKNTILLSGSQELVVQPQTDCGENDYVDVIVTSRPGPPEETKGKPEKGKQKETKEPVPVHYHYHYPPAATAAPPPPPSACSYQCTSQPVCPAACTLACCKKDQVLFIEAKSKIRKIPRLT